MADEDLRVTASLKDELSAPIRKVRREVKETRREVEKVDGASGKADRSLGKMTGGFGRASSGGGRLLGVVGKLTRSIGVGLVSAAKVGATAIVGLTGLAVVGLAKTVSMASEANESASKFATVFDGIPGVSAHVADLNKQFGITTQELQDASSTFGVFGKSAGVPQKQLGSFTTDLVDAGLDLSSFYNVDPGQVFEDLRSGLAGEAEPLRKYGVFISDATMKAKAAQMGLHGELTEGQKVMVRQKLIMGSLGDAQGDLARTSESVANKQRALIGRFKEGATQLGKVFLPVVGAAYVWLDKKLAPVISRLTHEAPKMAEALKAKRWGEFVLRLDAVLNTGGKLSRLFANIKDVLAGYKAFGPLGAAFQLDEALDSGTKVQDIVTKLTDVGRDLMTIWKDGLAPALANLGPLGLLAGSPLVLLDDVLSLMADHATALVPVLTVLAGVWATHKVVSRVAHGYRLAAGAIADVRSAASKTRGVLTKLFGAGGKSDGLRLRLMYVKDAAKRAGSSLATAAKGAGKWAAAGGRSASAWSRAKISQVASSAKSAASSLASGAKAAGRWSLAGIKAAATWARATAAIVANKVATIAQAVAAKASAIAQWALNAAMNANPVMLVVLAVAALVAAFVLAYKKVGWFRAAVDASVRFIGRAFTWVKDFVVNNWELMLAMILGPFGVAIALIVHHWDKVSGAVSWVIGKIGELWTASQPARDLLVTIGGIALEGLKSAIGWVILKIVDLWNQSKPVRELLGTIGSITLSVLKDAIGWVVDKVKWIIDNAGKVGDVLGGIGGFVSDVIPGGDTATRRTRGSGAASHTLGVGAYADGITAGRRTVTNVFHGSAGGASDHTAGRAFDVIGSNLQSYKATVGRLGGFAEMHGSGKGRHLHVAVGDTATPRARATASRAASRGGGGGGAPVVIGAGAIVVYPQNEMDLAAGIAQGIADYVRDQEER